LECTVRRTLTAAGIVLIDKKGVKKCPRPEMLCGDGNIDVHGSWLGVLGRKFCAK